VIVVYWGFMGYFLILLIIRIVSRMKAGRSPG